jgi:hypothetical protein
MALMKRKDSLATGLLLAYLAKWEDKQVCIITCSAE